MSLSNDLTPTIPDPDNTLVITLYIAGNAINSLRALTNLKEICEQWFSERYQLEVVDIFEQPLRALDDKVLLTPTLIKTAPGPRLVLIGDLRDKEMVRLALQVIDQTL